MKKKLKEQNDFLFRSGILASLPLLLLDRGLDRLGNVDRRLGLVLHLRGGRVLLLALLGARARVAGGFPLFGRCKRKYWRGRQKSQKT
jgi:hypothetical protein